MKASSIIVAITFANVCSAASPPPCGAPSSPSPRNMPPPPAYSLLSYAVCSHSDHRGSAEQQRLTDRSEKLAEGVWHCDNDAFRHPSPKCHAHAVLRHRFSRDCMCAHCAKLTRHVACGRTAILDLLRRTDRRH